VRRRGGGGVEHQLGEELAGDDGGQAAVVAAAGDEDDALGVPVGSSSGEGFVEDEEGRDEEGRDDVFGGGEVSLEAAGELGAGDPASAADGAEVLGEEDGGDAGFAGAGRPPEGDPVRGAGPARQLGGPGVLKVRFPALAGEAAVALRDSGVDLGEGFEGVLGVFADGADADVGDGPDGDLLLAATGARPEVLVCGHAPLPGRVMPAMRAACWRRMSSTPAARVGLWGRPARQDGEWNLTPGPSPIAPPPTGRGENGSGLAARSMTTRWM